MNSIENNWLTSGPSDAVSKLYQKAQYLFHIAVGTSAEEAPLLVRGTKKIIYLALGYFLLVLSPTEACFRGVAVLGHRIITTQFSGHDRTILSYFQEALVLKKLVLITPFIIFLSLHSPKFFCYIDHYATVERALLRDLLFQLYMTLPPLPPRQVSVRPLSLPPRSPAATTSPSASASSGGDSPRRGRTRRRVPALRSFSSRDITSDSRQQDRATSPIPPLRSPTPPSTSSSTHRSRAPGAFASAPIAASLGAPDSPLNTVLVEDHLVSSEPLPVVAAEVPQITRSSRSPSTSSSTHRSTGPGAFASTSRAVSPSVSDRSLPDGSDSSLTNGAQILVFAQRGRAPFPSVARSTDDGDDCFGVPRNSLFPQHEALNPIEVANSVAVSSIVGVDFLESIFEAAHQSTPAAIDAESSQDSEVALLDSSSPFDSRTSVSLGQTSRRASFTRAVDDMSIPEVGAGSVVSVSDQEDHARSPSVADSTDIAYDDSIRFVSQVRFLQGAGFDDSSEPIVSAVPQPTPAHLDPFSKHIDAEHVRSVSALLSNQHSLGFPIVFSNTAGGIGHFQAFSTQSQVATTYRVLSVVEGGGIYIPGDAAYSESDVNARIHTIFVSPLTSSRRRAAEQKAFIPQASLQEQQTGSRSLEHTQGMSLELVVSPKIVPVVRRSLTVVQIYQQPHMSFVGPFSSIVPTTTSVALHPRAVSTGSSSALVTTSQRIGQVWYPELYVEPRLVNQADQHFIDEQQRRLPASTMQVLQDDGSPASDPIEAIRPASNTTAGISDFFRRFVTTMHRVPYVPLQMVSRGLSMAVIVPSSAYRYSSNLIYNAAGSFALHVSGAISISF